MKTNLTDLQVKKMPYPEGGVVELTDAEAPGLILRVSSGRKKLWMVRYRPKGEAQRRVAIGQYPSMSLAQARVEAREYDRLAKLGRDRQKEEMADKAASERADRTLADVLKAYVAEYCKRNQKAWKQTEQMFDRYVNDTKLGRKPLIEVRRSDIADLLHDLLDKGLNAQVNRLHAQIKAALNWAVDREWLDANPAAALRRKLAQEHPRDRVLSEDELRAIWHAADGLKDPAKALIKVLMLTGQRRDEVRCMRWAELDMETGIWTLPAERNKAKRQHILPLPKQVTAIIKKLPRLNEYVFTIGGTKPYAGQKRLKDILVKAAHAEKWSRWTFHDFRRTAATGMSSLNIREEVVSRVLNHATRSVTQTYYNKYEFVKEKRDALQAWANYLETVVNSRSPIVVPIRQGRKAGERR